jgi:hypothetical protein
MKVNFNGKTFTGKLAKVLKEKGLGKETRERKPKEEKVKKVEND